MKKILVASDTHGRNENLKNVILKNRPIDKLIFCGDGEGLEKVIREMIGDECELYMVRGNNDYFSQLPWDIEFELGGLKAFLTHGHMYGVSVSEGRILEEARSRGCGICFYGHTHRPVEEKKEGIFVINPGSLSFPRQMNRKPSYMIIEEEDNGKLHFHQAYVER